MIVKRLGVILTAAAVLAGCGQASSVMQTPTVTLAPPDPRAWRKWRPNRCASLRSQKTSATAPRACGRSTIEADADAAVENIRQRGRLIVGLDIGSNLFSFRDPITGEITGFDVDIAGEVARDIFGTPSQVEYRILSSADRIAALQNNQVDIVVKTMTITCERRKLVNFSTVYFNANQRILAPRDSTDQRSRRTCPASGCASRRAPRRSTGSSRSPRRRSSWRW